MRSIHIKVEHGNIRIIKLGHMYVLRTQLYREGAFTEMSTLYSTDYYTRAVGGAVLRNICSTPDVVVNL